MSRRGLVALSLLLAVVGAIGAYSVNPATKVVTAAPPYRGHSSAAPPETTTSTIPYRRTTTTLLTAVLPAVQTPSTTAAPRPVTTTTTALAVTPATTTTLVPTTPCTWSTETFPQLNGASPTLFVHLSAPAMPNSTVAVKLFPHGSTVTKASQVGTTDGAGKANVAFPLSLSQLNTQVDLTAQFASGGLNISCSPKLHTATLTPLV